MRESCLSTCNCSFHGVYHIVSIQVVCSCGTRVKLALIDGDVPGACRCLDSAVLDILEDKNMMFLHLVLFVVCCLNHVISGRNIELSVITSLNLYYKRIQGDLFRTF